MLSHPQDQSLKAGHGFAPSEWAVLAHGGAPALRSPPRQGPRSPAPCRAAAPGRRLTHARAGSGGTCVVPPPTRGCCATGCHRAAGARCQWGGGGWPPWAPRPVGSASSPPPPPVGVRAPPLGCLRCHLAVAPGRGLRAGGGGPQCPNQLSQWGIGTWSPELVASEEHPRHAQWGTRQEGLPRRGHGSLPVADGTQPHHPCAMCTHSSAHLPSPSPP